MFPLSKKWPPCYYILLNKALNQEYPEILNTRVYPGNKNKLVSFRRGGWRSTISGVVATVLNSLTNHVQRRIVGDPKATKNEPASRLFSTKHTENSSVPGISFCIRNPIMFVLKVRFTYGGLFYGVVHHCFSRRKALLFP